MDNGTRFAVGLLILWGAMLLLFIALHHNGIAGAKNPGDALKWLITEFQDVTGITNAAAGTGPQNAGAAPTETGA